MRKDNLLSGFDNIPGEEFGKHRSCYVSYINVKRLREGQGNVAKRRSSRDSRQQGITYSCCWSLSQLALSVILYFGDNDLSLQQFRYGGNDSKNRSEHFRDNKKLKLLFWSSFRLPYWVCNFTKIQLSYLKVVLTRGRFMIFKFSVKAKL